MTSGLPRRSLLIAFGLVLSGHLVVEAQTYRLDVAGKLTDRSVRIVQTNSAGTEVHIFDPATLELVARLEGLPLAHGVTLHADGKYYYFTNETEATVDVVDTRTLEIVARIPLAGRPNNISASDRARKLYVAIVAEPLVQVIDMDTHEIVKNIPAAGGVHNTFVTPDGRYAVAGMIGASTLMAIDTETDEVVWEKRFAIQQNPFTGGIRPFAFTTYPDGTTQWILVNVGGWHGFWVMDWKTQEVLRQISPPLGEAWSLADQTADGIQSAPSHGIVVLPDQSQVWHSSRATSHIYGWSLPDFEYLGRVRIGNPAWLTATPDSRYVWVGVASHNETAVVDVKNQAVIRRFPVGQAPKRIYTAVFPAGWEGESKPRPGSQPRQNAAPQAAAPAAGDAAHGLDFEAYRTNVEPILLRQRGGFVGSDSPCVACHTYQASTPLRLEPLGGAGNQPGWTEEQSRRNLQVVSRLVDPANPEASRLLRAPLSPAAGGTRHSGGVFWDSRDHPEWRAIHEWVSAATPEAGERPPAAAGPAVDFEFFRHCVQPLFVSARADAVACSRCHAGDFARPIPRGQTTWTEEESRRAFEAILHFIEPGDPEYTRFLHKPLHPDAGGDLMHNGPRRWTSQADPEWQALAAWVRGEATGPVCPPALRFEDRSP